jgi:hypothetical protein
MKAFYEAFPPAQSCGPVIARFDQMSSPFQALLWGRVLPLQTFDEARIKAYWEQWGGRTNLEPLCPTPNQSSVPTVSSEPSTSAPPSAAPSVAPTAAPSVAAPAAPSAAAPSPS